MNKLIDWKEGTKASVVIESAIILARNDTVPVTIRGVNYDIRNSYISRHKSLYERIKFSILYIFKKL